MKVFIKILRVLLIFILIFFVGISSFLFYFTRTDYQPKPEEKIIIRNSASWQEIDSVPLTFITWNIGYCGLDKDMDFFYDGGKKVRPTESEFQKNLNGVFDFLSKNDSVDFILLQEVDSFSKRSYYTGQVSLFSKALQHYSWCFATNYNVKLVPLPVFNPMGKVLSGITTFSKYTPGDCRRYSYPVNYSWPMSIFMLDRCFMVQRYKLSSGNKELVLINLHNSAFSDADVLRLYETWMLRSFLLSEFEKGNFVIVGGDWNQNTPDYNKLSFISGFNKKTGLPKLPADYLPQGWKIVHDTLLPTNRDVETPYVHGKTPTTIYDFFITSPNITVERVNVINCGFEFSDHQPVYMRVWLNLDPVSGCNSEIKNIIITMQDSIRKLNEKISPWKFKNK